MPFGGRGGAVAECLVSIPKASGSVLSKRNKHKPRSSCPKWKASLWHRGSLCMVVSVNLVHTNSCVLLSDCAPNFTLPTCIMENIRLPPHKLKSQFCSRTWWNDFAFKCPQFCTFRRSSYSEWIHISSEEKELLFQVATVELFCSNRFWHLQSIRQEMILSGYYLHWRIPGTMT